MNGRKEGGATLSEVCLSSVRAVPFTASRGRGIHAKTLTRTPVSTIYRSAARRLEGLRWTMLKGGSVSVWTGAGLHRGRGFNGAWPAAGGRSPESATQAPRSVTSSCKRHRRREAPAKEAPGQRDATEAKKVLMPLV